MRQYDLKIPVFLYIEPVSKVSKGENIYSFFAKPAITVHIWKNAIQ